MTVPRSVVQYVAQHQYQGFQSTNFGIPFSYPEESSTYITSQYAYLGEPYALFGVQFGHISWYPFQLFPNLHGCGPLFPTSTIDEPLFLNPYG